MENTNPTETSKDQPASAPRRIPKGTIKLQFAGDLILARCPNRDLDGLFRRYESLFEVFANMDREERLVNYKFLNALMLTSYAKKTENMEEKKELFSKKNKLFLDIASKPNQRRKVAFKYLASKNFRVLEFCKRCTEKNEKENNKKHSWKFCKGCNIDRNFFNVVSMYHRYDNGEACIFLSNDQVENLPVKSFKLKGKLEDHKEEAKFKNYIYTVKNLDAISLGSVIEMYEKILGK